MQLMERVTEAQRYAKMVCNYAEPLLLKVSLYYKNLLKCFVLTVGILTSPQTLYF